MSGELIAALRGVATSVNAQLGASSWYLFGSALRDERDANDIDLVIICPSHEIADSLRQAVDVDCLPLPIHLSIFTEAEQAEIGFIETQGCVQIV